MAFNRDNNTSRGTNSGYRNDGAPRRFDNDSRNRFSRTEEVVPVVEVPKVPIDPTAHDLIAFKDRYYDIGKIRGQLKAAPKIDVEVGELHENYMGLAIPTRELPEDVLNLEPVFTKFEGKYVVLLGKHRVLAKMDAKTAEVLATKRIDNSQTEEERKFYLKGTLLSNPTLKKCAVE